MTQCLSCRARLAKLAHGLADLGYVCKAGGVAGGGNAEMHYDEAPVDSFVRNLYIHAITVRPWGCTLHLLQE